MVDKTIVNPELGLPIGFQYTQSKLQDFEDCPRRFYLKYILNQQWPAPLAEPQDDIEKAMRRGQRFHRMIERHQLGMTLDILRLWAGNDTQVQEWLDRYAELLPRIGSFDSAVPEAMLTTTVGGYPLLAKFDLLGLQGQSVIAVDWKTGRLPVQYILAQRMQTVVYLYVLYQKAAHWLGIDHVGNYTLTYASVRTNELHSFEVDAKNVDSFAQRIRAVIDSIDTSDFSKVANQHPCRYCVYRSLCERGTTPQLEEALDLEDSDYWDTDIAGEIEF